MNREELLQELQSALVVQDLQYVRELQEVLLSLPDADPAKIESILKKAKDLHLKMKEPKEDSMNNDNFNKKVEEIVEKFKKAKQGNFMLLLVGRVGVGKSSTINSLMGQNVAPVNDYEPETMEIVPYKSELNGVKYTVFDTPGLCDDLEGKNSYKYLEMMRKQIERVDCTWFVTTLDDTRVRKDEKDGIKLISECFGKELWKQSVIVFTCADKVSQEDYLERLEKRAGLIRKEIGTYLGMADANNIPAVAVSNKSATTPDGEEWLGELFTQTFLRLGSEGSAAFFMSMINEIKFPETPDFGRLMQEIREQQAAMNEEQKRYLEDVQRRESELWAEREEIERERKRWRDENNTDDFSPRTSQPSTPSSEPRIRLSEAQAEKVVEKAKTNWGSVAVGAMAGAIAGAAIGGPVGAIGGAVIGSVGGWFSGRRR